MTNITIDEPTEYLATLAHLTVVVDQFRSLRARMTEETDRSVTFTEVADSVASTSQEASLQEYLKELGEILDKHTAAEVDEDLDVRFLNAASRLEQAEPAGLPKLLP